MNPKSFLTVTALGLALSLLPATFAQEKPAPAKPTDAEVIAKARAEYPLKACVVSDEALGSLEEATAFIHRSKGKPDQVLFFCCEGCVDDFKAAPAKYLEKLEKAGTSAAKPADKRQSASGKKGDYPLTVCAVTGKPLGSMGEPYDHIHTAANGEKRLVRMCCDSCIRKFNQEPAKYLAKIDAAKK